MLIVPYSLNLQHALRTCTLPCHRDGKLRGTFPGEGTLKVHKEYP